MSKKKQKDLKTHIPKKDINFLEIPSRPRRNRKSEIIRNLVNETLLTPGDLIYPVFIHDKDFDEEIISMPGCMRFSIKGLIKEIKRSMNLGIGSFVLFPAIDESLKSPLCEEAYNSNGLVPRTIESVKNELPDAILITDVALDPYSSEGHDGIVSESGEILNDFTVEILCKQALCHARSGVDIVSPSDMMDGRIGAIRELLDKEGFTDISRC